MTSMFGFEDIVCCTHDCSEEEVHYETCSPYKQADGCRMRCTPAESLRLQIFRPRYYRAPPAPVSMSLYLQPPHTTFSLLGDCATSLAASHASGVVHGNLRPESVRVVHRKALLIGVRHPPDRGLSRTREAAEEEDDIYGARWAATELFRLDNSNPCPTKMSDVYSFACLMLQMLTGAVPYCGTKRPEQVVYLKYLGREPIDAQTPKVAERYVAFMRWCWSPEPEKRPTMEAVVSFIQEEIKRLGE